MKNQNQEKNALLNRLPGWIAFPPRPHEWVWFVLRVIFFISLTVFFFCRPAWYTKVNATGIVHYKKKLMLLLPTGGLLCVFLPLLRLRLPRPLRGVINLAAAIVLPLLALGRAEMVQGYHFWSIKQLFIEYNVALAVAVFAIFFVVTNRVRVSAMLTYLFIVGFGILNHYIYQFRGEPINAADLYVVGTALNVAGSYNFEINKNVFFALYETAVLFSLMHWLPPEERGLRLKPRLAIIVFAVYYVTASFRFYALSDEPLSHGLQVKQFRPMQSYKKDGELLCFVRGFYYMVIQKPENYTSVGAAEQMQQSGYVSDAADADDGVQNPNIILILNESLTDFSGYDAVKPSEDPLEFIHSLSESHAPNAIVGTLHTDVFGGRTANSEYEVLTGNSIAFLPYNTVPYALFLRHPTPSIVWNLRDMGYASDMAFHPYKGNGYSRPRAYPNLGFTDFISIEDIEETLTEKDYVRNRVSDYSDFERVIGYYEESKAQTDAPFYMFNVTMQNHGGFTQDYKNFDQNITLSGELAEDDAARRYLNLTEYTDEAFQMLTEYFAGTEDPTLILMFGDHKPNLHHSFYPTIFGKKVSQLDDYEEFQRYDTPVVLWANYDINPEGRYDEMFENISINYLSSALMQVAGLPMTAYQKFELDMLQQIPVFTAHGYLDRNGMFYETDDKTSPYYDLVQQYYTFEYNYQFDSNRVEDFFRLEADTHTIDSAED